MEVFQMNKEVLKFLCLSFYLTQILLQCCSSTPIYEDVKFGNASCNYSGIAVDVFLESNFEGIIYSQGNLFNPSCSYHASFASDTQNISFFLPLTDCGTVIRELHETIHISNMIVVQKHHFVETAFDVVHNISCEFPYSGHLETEDALTHGNHSNRYKNNVFESWMDFKLGSDATGKDVPNKLLVGDQFSIVIHLKDRGINKDLEVESCWAYDGESIKESQYIFNIYDRHKCGSSEWVSEFNLTKGEENVSDSMAYAVSKAFKFPLTKTVHITCYVQVCTNICWDSCKMSELQKPKIYPRILKRSTQVDNSDKNLRDRYRLMKATVKALGTKLIESKKESNLKNISAFNRRISHSEMTSASDYEDFGPSEEYFDEENERATSNSQFGNPEDSQDNYSTTEYYPNYVYVFNLTKNIEVVSGHKFSFGRYIAPTEQPTKCVTKLKFSMVLGSLGFLVFCLLSTCIGLALYLRKERKTRKIDNFLLYNFY